MYRKKHAVLNIASILLALYSLIAIFLVLITFMGALKTKPELIKNILGLPQNPTLDHFKVFFAEGSFFKYILNSVILTGLGVISVLSASSMVAYGLARYRFRGKTLLQMFFLLGLMFPIQLGILPNFILLRTLRLTNRFGGMVLLYAANISFSVFIFFKFFQTLPYSLQEAAKIDGAGEFTVFLRIMLPLSQPVFVTVGLIKVLELWNDFYLPMVFLTSENVRTVPLEIYRYIQQFLSYLDKVLPAVVISIIPIIVIFLVGADQIVDGLTSGAMKQ